MFRKIRHIFKNLKLILNSISTEEYNDLETLLYGNSPKVINIIRAKNGYIVEDKEENGVYCFEEVDIYDRDISEGVALQSLFYYLKESFGIHYSKHKKNNLVMMFQDGENIEDTTLNSIISEEIQSKLYESGYEVVKIEPN